MKRHIFILALIFSFFITNAQNEEINKEISYILTTDNEKLPFDPSKRFINFRNILMYRSPKVFSKTSFLKKDVEEKIPIKIYQYENEGIEIDKIVKIIDSSIKYMTIKDKKRKHTRIYRVVAENENYTLGFFSVLNEGESLRFLIVDNKANEIIEDGNLIDFDGIELINFDDVDKKSIATIKKYFGTCIGQKDLLVKIYSDPYKMFLNGEESTAQKEKGWYKYIRGSWINIADLYPYKLEFLPDFNQHKCE